MRYKLIDKHILIDRINRLGKILESKDDALALIGLGSIGDQRNRLDQYSDLDFFVIVKNNSKQKYIDNLDWLNEVMTVKYQFKNSQDGYKFFFEDGIYGEFAVFSIDEIESIHQSKGKVIWKVDQLDLEILEKSKGTKPELISNDIDFIINEALTNIYVGLQRYFRGEKLNAYRFIETYAFNNLQKIIHLSENVMNYYKDEYSLDRRFEMNYPLFSNNLENMLKGYNHILDSARNIYYFIKRHYEISLFIAKMIEDLLNQDNKG
jgi:lincosamide nucleotidyltransferase B/F